MLLNCLISTFLMPAVAITFFLHYLSYSPPPWLLWETEAGWLKGKSPHWYTKAPGLNSIHSSSIKQALPCCSGARSGLRSVIFFSCAAAVFMHPTDVFQVLPGASVLLYLPINCRQHCHHRGKPPSNQTLRRKPPGSRSLPSGSPRPGL